MINDNVKNKDLNSKLLVIKLFNVNLTFNKQSFGN